MWRPSWPCDPDAVNKLVFPLPIEASPNTIVIGFDWPSGSGGVDHGNTVSSPGEPAAQVS